MNKVQKPHVNGLTASKLARARAGWPDAKNAGYKTREQPRRAWSKERGCTMLLALVPLAIAILAAVWVAASLIRGLWQ